MHFGLVCSPALEALFRNIVSYLGESPKSGISQMCRLARPIERAISEAP
jgi:hypothetical protein